MKVCPTWEGNGQLPFLPFVDTGRVALASILLQSLFITQFFLLLSLFSAGLFWLPSLFTIKFRSAGNLTRHLLLPGFSQPSKTQPVWSSSTCL